ncbi:MAG: hypothetical protein WKF41_09130 [Gaiellaceae bacterium]
MAYATPQELLEYLLDNDEVVAPDAEAVGRLLGRAEGDVDRAVGPWPVLSTGRKFDPPALDLVQRAALSRACCAACEFRLQLGESGLVGDDDYAPEGVQVIRRGGRTSPKMLEELSGSGLVRRSGTVVTPVVVVLP